MSSCIQNKERYLLVRSDGAGVEEYGIKAISDDGAEVVIGNISDNIEFAMRVMDFLNENEVAPEHLLQILEEILCGWICLDD